MIAGSLLAIAVGGAVLVSGSLGDSGPRACISGPRHGTVHPPAPITVEASVTSKRGRFLGLEGYRIGCDGRLRRIGRIHGSSPGDGAFGSAPGVWWAIRHDHLVIGRGNRTVWRSHGRFGALIGIGGVQLGSRTVAFSYDNNLYLAPLGGAERAIGRAENALGFTRGGIYTISWIHGLVLRSDSGVILKTFVHWTQEYFASAGRLYFISHGLLMSARGAHVWRLASLANLGMSANVWLQPLSTEPWSQTPTRLLALEDNNRLTVLRPDGSLYATSSSRTWGSGGVASSAVVAPRSTAVAFTSTSGKTNTAETVYLLRANARSAVPVYTRRGQFGGCGGGGATVQWHGTWLLYSDSRGDLAAIDTSGAHRVIDLTRVVRRFRRLQDGFSGYWSGQAPGSSS